MTAISRCGWCGNPEDAHEGATPEETEIMLALIGCHGFRASRATVAKVKALAAVPRNVPIHPRCGTRHAPEESCPW